MYLQNHLRMLLYHKYTWISVCTTPHHNTSTPALKMKRSKKACIHEFLCSLTGQKVCTYWPLTCVMYIWANHLHASPDIIKLFFIVLINIKMPTIVGIFSFICMINQADRSAHLRSQTTVNRCLEGIAKYTMNNKFSSFLCFASFCA